MATENEMRAKWMTAAKWIYWATTILVCSAMLSGGIMMLLGNEQNVKGITDLGYPAYLCTILGVAKILGSIVILFGKRCRTLKEWAYAGFSFDLLGASASYVLHGGEPLFHAIAPLVLLLMVLSSHRQWKTGWM